MTEYHEGKPTLLAIHDRVVLLCQHGHVLEAMPASDWARSQAEMRMEIPVRCYGTLPTGSTAR